jgi:hypothetical protein
MKNGMKNRKPQEHQHRPHSPRTQHVIEKHKTRVKWSSVLWPFLLFWEHVSRHYDTIHGYQNVPILTRISCLMLPDSSICEVGFPHATELTPRRERTWKQAQFVTCS